MQGGRPTFRFSGPISETRLTYVCLTFLVKNPKAKPDCDMQKLQPQETSPPNPLRGANIDCVDIISGAERGLGGRGDTETSALRAANIVRCTTSKPMFAPRSGPW
jgi:hypothetical protein